MAREHNSDAPFFDMESFVAHRQSKDGSKTEVASEPAQPSSSDQSGSAGRSTESAKHSQGKDSGQNRYGQSGFVGGEPRETMGQWKYRDSEKQGTPDSKSQSNRGSGRADAETQEYQGKEIPAPPARKKP